MVGRCKLIWTTKFWIYSTVWSLGPSRIGPLARLKWAAPQSHSCTYFLDPVLFIAAFHSLFRRINDCASNSTDHRRDPSRIDKLQGLELVSVSTTLLCRISELRGTCSHYAVRTGISSTCYRAGCCSHIPHLILSFERACRCCKEAADVCLSFVYWIYLSDRRRLFIPLHPMGLTRTWEPLLPSWVGRLFVLLEVWWYISFGCSRISVALQDVI